MDIFQGAAGNVSSIWQYMVISYRSVFLAVDESRSLYELGQILELCD